MDEYKLRELRRLVNEGMCAAEGNLRLWVVEAERWLKGLREGRAKEISAEDTFRLARHAIL